MQQVLQMPILNSLSCSMYRARYDDCTHGRVWTAQRVTTMLSTLGSALLGSSDQLRASRFTSSGASKLLQKLYGPYRGPPPLLT